MNTVALGLDSIAWSDLSRGTVDLSWESRSNRSTRCHSTNRNATQSANTWITSWSLRSELVDEPRDTKDKWQRSVQKADSLVIPRHCAHKPTIMCQRHETCENLTKIVAKPVCKFSCKCRAVGHNSHKFLSKTSSHVRMIVHNHCHGLQKFRAISAIIESSKSTDTGICCGLSFLGNAESPRNLQQTEAESEEFGICETLTNFLTDCSYRNRWTP